MLQELEDLLAEKIGQRTKLNYEIGILQGAKLLLQVSIGNKKPKSKTKK